MTARAEPDQSAGGSLRARRAEALGARLPPLLVAAERVASTVAQGVHGRRRVGTGDSFWQYRQFVPGDPVGRIDWRQSAKSDHAFIRETEWEAAQTVVLWRDVSASMRWRSGSPLPEKAARADLLLLALASLLLRGGERVRLLGATGLSPRALQGRAALDRLAEAMAHDAGAGVTTQTGTDLPQEANLPRHARVVLIGDFLAPIEAIEAVIGRLARVPVQAHLLQVLDPAESDLPFNGRVRFRGLEREADDLVPRVEAVRADYRAALASQQSALAALCAAAGFGFATHRTDHPAEAALLGLYLALSDGHGIQARQGTRR